MRTLQEMADGVRATGVLWLAGEMEFAVNQGVKPAYDTAVHIASQCGYLVTDRTPEGFDVCDGSLQGIYRLRWPSKDALQLQSIAHLDWPTDSRGLYIQGADPVELESVRVE